MNQNDQRHQAYLGMLREHDELRSVLGEVSEVTTACKASVAEVQKVITALCEHIGAHFEAEESGGYFSEAVLQAPRVSERVAALKAEHDELRKQIAGLADFVTGFDASSEHWKQLGEQVHQFSVELMHHENKENELLQEVFTEDIGSKD